MTTNQDNWLWYKDAVFYELHVRAFRDSDGDGRGDFKGLLSKLDYLKDLGVDCIWLLPFYPSPLIDDGYDVEDYRGIHQQFGTLEDLKTLLDAVHARGMHLIIDIVVNHTSDQHPWFVQSRSSRESSKRDWYVWSDTDEKYKDTRVIFKDTLKSNWTFDPQTNAYYWHRFYAQQPDLNYDNPEVQQEMLDIIDYWMAMGVDGFRVDAVPYLFEREGTNCENLPETHAYIKRMRAHVNEHWPGRILLAEANQWPEDVSVYMSGDEFHMGFHFPIMPRLFMALKQRSRTSIVDILRRTPELPALSQWCGFLRNHDELTLEMVTEEEREFMWAQYAPEPRMRLNLGIRRRLAPLLDNDMRRIKLLNAMLFTLPGSPIIYYGDEIGMGDNIALPDRNGVRTPMQWNASFNAGFSGVEPDKLYSPLIDDWQYGYRQVNVERQQADPNSLWHAMRHMIRVRKQYHAFGRGTFSFVLPENETVLGYWRIYTEDRVTERLLVIVNLADQPQTATFELSGYNGKSPVDVLSGEQLPEIQLAPYTLELAPYAYHWLKIG